MRISDWSSDVCSSDLGGYSGDIAVRMRDPAISPDSIRARSGPVSRGSEPVSTTLVKPYRTSISCNCDCRRGAGRSAAPAHLGSVKCTRSEEHTSELQSLMRTSYAVLCLQKTKHN